MKMDQQDIKDKIELVSRNGKCLKCGENLDGGDILEHVARMDIYMGRPYADIQKAATEMYSYTDQNKSRFTKLIHVKPHNHPEYYECPNCHTKYEPEQVI